MRSKEDRSKDSAEKSVREIHRATRRQYSVAEKIRIVLEGLRGEDGIAELCRKERINQNLYYRWSKELLEAGKKRLGDQRPVRCHINQQLVALANTQNSLINSRIRNRHRRQGTNSNFALLGV